MMLPSVSEVRKHLTWCRWCHRRSHATAYHVHQYGQLELADTSSGIRLCDQHAQDIQRAACPDHGKYHARIIWDNAGTSPPNHSVCAT